MHAHRHLPAHGKPNWFRPGHGLLFLVLILIGACTNSSFALKVFYNQLDTLMKRELLSYADFTDQQERLIRNEIDRTLTWHRREELPRLANSLGTLQRRLLRNEIELADVEWLFNELRSAGNRFESKSPLVALSPLIKTLDNQQAEQIRESILQEMDDKLEEIEKKQKSDLAESSAKEFSKFLSRFGLEVSPSQQKDIVDHFKDRQITRRMIHDIDVSWTTKFLALLDNRQSDDFVADFRAHHLARSELTKNTYPDKYEHDNDLFTDMLLVLFRSLSPEQQASIRAQTSEYIELARELALEKS